MGVMTRLGFRGVAVRVRVVLRVVAHEHLPSGQRAADPPGDGPTPRRRQAARRRHRTQLAGFSSVTIILACSLMTLKITLSPGLKASSSALSFTSKTIVIGGMSSCLISP